MYAPAGRYVMQDCCPNTNLLVDYNLYWSASGSPVASLIGKTGAHDKEADPLFVNPSVDPAVADFHLKAGSPAIDAGTSAGATAVDFDGNARPFGAGIDMGAYEYGAGSAVRPAHAAGTAASPAIRFSQTFGQAACASVWRCAVTLPFLRWTDRAWLHLRMRLMPIGRLRVQRAEFTLSRRQSTGSESPQSCRC